MQNLTVSDPKPLTPQLAVLFGQNNHPLLGPDILDSINYFMLFKTWLNEEFSCRAQKPWGLSSDIFIKISQKEDIIEPIPTKEDFGCHIERNTVSFFQISVKRAKGKGPVSAMYKLLGDVLLREICLEAIASVKLTFTSKNLL